MVVMMMAMVMMMVPMVVVVVMMRTRPRMRMGVLRIVLTQQVLAVIVAVGRAHHGVDVVARRRVVVVDDARLVVELDQDDWAQDAIVERARIIERTDPGEQRIAQVTLRLGISHIGMPRPQPASIKPQQ